MEKLPLELIFGQNWRTLFYETTRSSAPIHIEGHPSKFKWLMNYHYLSTILNRNQSNIGSPPWRVYHSGNEVTCENATHVKNALKDGASIIFNDADRYSSIIGNFITSLSRQLSCTCRANIYYSQPSVSAFKAHWDTHQFFIIQCEGRKEWRIWDKPVKNAVFFGRQFENSPPSDAPNWKIVLNPGDVLYVPLGFWHEATCIQEPSIHLTIGMFSPNQVDFMMWLAREMYNEEDSRQTFPIVIAGDERDEWAKYVQKTIEYVSDLRKDPVRLLESFLSFRAETARDYNPFTEGLLSGQRTPFSESETYRVSRGILYFSSGTDRIKVVTCGEIFSFNIEQARLLSELASKETFNGDDVPEKAGDFIAALIDKGLITYA